MLRLWNAIANFRLGVLPEHDISLQDFRHPMIFRQNGEESCIGYNTPVIENFNYVPVCRDKATHGRYYGGLAILRENMADRIMVLNATFNNISAISWCQFYWWR